MTDTGPQPPEEPAPPGVVDLIGRAIASLMRIAQGEAALLRAEAAHAGREIAMGLGLAVVAAILGFVGLLALAAAAVLALIGLGLSPAVAALTVAGITLVLALGLLQAGLARFKAANLTPRRSLDSLRRDMDIFRETSDDRAPRQEE